VQEKYFDNERNSTVYFLNPKTTEIFLYDKTTEKFKTESLSLNAVLAQNITNNSGTPALSSHSSKIPQYYSTV